MDRDTEVISSVERQVHLLRFIEQRQRVTVAQICDQFSVSPATARRDLDALAEQGKIQRVHGGAIPIRQAPPELPVVHRLTEQSEEKQRIGRATAALVADGDTVYLGNGTTVLEVARNLLARRNLTVITNSLMVLNAMADSPNVTLISLGGLLRRSELSMIGHITEQALAELRADKVIIGVHAIDAKHGLTNQYLPETMTDRAILKIGRQVIVVADHTKCGRIATAVLTPVDAVDLIVTDSGIDDEIEADLRDRGARILKA
jgi:DeoR/GlpR family transcriptional regulator of sugar metabolism